MYSFTEIEFRSMVVETIATVDKAEDLKLD